MTKEIKEVETTGTLSTLELLELTIIHMSEFADMTYMEYLLSLVRDSEYSHLSPIIKKIIKYFKENGIIPSAKYFKENWGATVDKDIPFLREYASELVARLKTSIIYAKVKDIANSDEPPENFQESLQECLIKYTPEKTNRTFDSRNLAESMRQSQVRKRARGAGLLTYTSIDKYTNGCPFGQTTVIGAPPKSCKSTIAMSIAMGAVTKQHLKGVYISLEISAETVHQKLYSRYLYDKGILIDNKDMIKGTLSEQDSKVYNQYLEEYQEAIGRNLLVVTQEDLPDLTRLELEAFLIKKDLEMGGLDFVIVDQASLLKYFKGITIGNGTDRNSKTFDVVNAYIRYFTIASFTLFQKQVAMIILSQIKRDDYKSIMNRKAIDLSCFAEASELERSANIAVVLRLDEQLKNSQLIEMYLIVNRDGDPCTEYVPNVCIPRHCYIADFGNAETHADSNLEDDTSSLFNFMEGKDDIDIDQLFKED